MIERASAIVHACERRSREIVDALRGLSDDEMRAPSALPDWSRLTILCHIRYGTAAHLAMTPAVVHGQPTSYYPGGRVAQRPGTLEPEPGESPTDVLDSFERACDELYALWETLTPSQWEQRLIEPDDNRDLGSPSMYELAILRLTETDVHGIDFELGLSDWSDELSHAGLPFRIGRLRLRTVPAGATGAWRLQTHEGESYGVTVSNGLISLDTRLGAATISGSRRDLFALLMGRSFVGDVAGPVESFREMFPGP